MINQLLKQKCNNVQQTTITTETHFLLFKMQKELQRIDIEFEGIDYVVSVPKQKGQYMKMKSLKYTSTPCVNLSSNL